MPGKTEQIFMDPVTKQKFRMVNNSWVEIQDDPVPKVDPGAFRDVQVSLRDLDEMQGKIKWNNTGGMFGHSMKVPLLGELNQSNIDLTEGLAGTAARGALGRIMRMKQESPTGASPLGPGVSDRDVQMVKDALANFSTRQSAGQLHKQLMTARETLAMTPGSTPKSAIDLSKGQSRTLIPQGAWYKSPDGKIRRNDNFDKGNPVLEQLQGTDNKAARKKKYGLED